MIQGNRSSGSHLVRALGVAVSVAALGLGITACGGDSDPQASGTSGAASSAATSNGTTAAPSRAGDGSAAPTASGTALPGSTAMPTGTLNTKTPGSDSAGVTITSCTATKAGVKIDATVKNTTTGVRTYVVSVKVRANGKDAGGAALLASSVPANGSAKATGMTKTPVKGKPTCAVTGVNGIDG